MAIFVLIFGITTADATLALWSVSQSYSGGTFAFTGGFDEETSVNFIPPQDESEPVTHFIDADLSALGGMGSVTLHLGTVNELYETLQSLEFLLIAPSGHQFHLSNPHVVEDAGETSLTFSADLSTERIAGLWQIGDGAIMEIIDWNLAFNTGSDS